MEGQSWADTASIISELEGILARREEVRGIEEILRVDAEIRRSVQTRSEDARKIIQDLARAVAVEEKNVVAPAHEAHAEEIRTLTTEKENIGASLNEMRSTIEEKEASLKALEKGIQEEDAAAAEADARHQRVAVPRVRHAISLFQNITHITWRYDTADVAGFIAAPHAQRVQEFSVAARKSDFDIANELWGYVEGATLA